MYPHNGILFRAFSVAIKVHMQTRIKECKDRRLKRKKRDEIPPRRLPRLEATILYPWISHQEISISAFLSTIPRSRTDYALIHAGPTGWRIRPIFLLFPISSIISVSFRALEKLTLPDMPNRISFKGYSM